jgi:hypothetical protein
MICWIRKCDREESREGNSDQVSEGCFTQLPTWLLRPSGIRLIFPSCRDEAPPGPSTEHGILSIQEGIVRASNAAAF